MRPTAIIIAGAILAIGSGLARAEPDPTRHREYRIVLPRRALGPGERVELKLEPPPPPDARVSFHVGSTGPVLSSGVYRAPYVIPDGSQPASVSGGFSWQRTRVGVSTEIELLPGSVSGAEDCLGPGQSFSTVWGSIEPEFTHVDELPELLHRVEPEYPRSALARGITDTITVQALVCRSGRVLDAYAVPGFRRGDLEPIQHDAKLIEAAETAVRQYVFKPGLVAGAAVATWVATPVAFRP